MQDTNGQTLGKTELYVCISIDRIRLLNSHPREAQYDEYTSESEAKKGGKKDIYAFRIV